MSFAQDPIAETEWLSRARAGDAAAFDRLVGPRRRQLHTHCYRMLGSPFATNFLEQAAASNDGLACPPVSKEMTRPG